MSRTVPVEPGEPPVPNASPGSTLSPEPDGQPRDQAVLHRTISRVLLGGLLLAVLLLVAGVVLTLVRPGLPLRDGTSLLDVPRAIAALEPVGFFDAGLLILMATPVAGVVALCVGYARRRSWLFCGLSLFILAVLALSAFLGLKG